jgi:hypothetical protein
VPPGPRVYDPRISFFDSPPEPPPRPPRPPHQRIQAWAGPPEDVAPGIVALELFLVHTDRQAHWIDHAEVYPEGVALEVHLHGRQEARQGVEAGPGTWRFGVQFSDGRKATSYGLGVFARMPGGRSNSAGASTVTRSVSAVAVPIESLSPPETPVLRSHGGGGSRRAWRQRYWLWPLPPAGELLLACEWPDLGIEFTTQTISADSLLAAARRARPLWPDDGSLAAG